MLMGEPIKQRELYFGGELYKMENYFSGWTRIYREPWYGWTII